MYLVGGGGGHAVLQGEAPLVTQGLAGRAGDDPPPVMITLRQEDRENPTVSGGTRRRNFYLNCRGRILCFKILKAASSTILVLKFVVSGL